MKKIITPLFLLFLNQIAFAQAKIITVSTTDVVGGTATNYVAGGNTYNWATSPNNVQKRVTSFSTAAGNFGYASALAGVVKLKRSTGGPTGDFSLVWSEASVTASPYNMQAAMPVNMESYFSANIFNKGTDNLFDNSNTNSNNIERLDWILSAGYSTANVTKTGFAVFERGADDVHDPFDIAAVTGLDVSGNPNAYGPVLRILSTNYGNITNSSVSFRILKGASGTNLLDATTNTQNRGGVFLSLSDLGITAGATVYGYSLLAADFPSGATSADIVNTSNTTNFPVNTGNTGNPGGIDLIATTGIFADVTVLPISIESFTAKQENYNKLYWKITDTENEINNFTILKSTNAVDFFEIGNVKSINNIDNYNFTDYNSAKNYTNCYYKLVIKKKNGQSVFSSIVKINGIKNTAATIFPNPVLTDAVINCNVLIDGYINMLIINTKGEEIISQKTKVQKGSNNIQLKKVEALKPGAYIVKIILPDEQAQSIPFIKK